MLPIQLMLAALLSLNLVIPILSSQLHITDLSKNPGIVAINLGKTYIKEGNHLLIHTFELYPFRAILKQYENIVRKIDSNIFNAELVEILKLKYKETDSTFQNLVLKQKQKRSLDFLGTSIKFITGNLDHNDLTKINYNINHLRTVSNLLVTENNEQIKINDLFEKRINNLTKIAYKQANEIASFITQARLDLNITVHWENRQHLQKIIFNLDIIQHQLDAIFESIQVARVGIISKAILHSSELDFATSILEAENITINHLDEVYEFLEPAVFHNGSSIIFIIKIPKFREGSYKQVLIETIPFEAKTIFVNAKYAILSSNETYLTNKSCSYIERNILCDIHNVKNATNGPCLNNLLRGNPSQCIFIKDNDNSTIIQTIRDNDVMIKNAITPILLQNTCGYGPRNVTGTVLISFRNCSITIDNAKYSSVSFVFEQLPEILPLHAVSVDRTPLLTMEPLEDLHIIHRKEINRLETSSRRNQGSILMVACISVMIIIYIVYELKSIRSFISIKGVSHNMITPSISNNLNRDGSI